MSRTCAPTSLMSGRGDVPKPSRRVVARTPLRGRAQGAGPLTIRAREQNLTEGYDSWINAYQLGPLVSEYHAAEWFAWNWWRLRWEPQPISPDWWRAHKTVSIGKGHVWLNIIIFSDKMKAALISQSSSRSNAKPFRYVGTHHCVLASSEFEATIDVFIPQIRARLRDSGIAKTHLDRVWQDVLVKRSNPDAASRRKPEALLGTDPDDENPELVEQLVRDANALGKDPISELAADI